MTTTSSREPDILETEKAFLLANREELEAANRGKPYLLIRGAEVHGAFETFGQGVSFGLTLFPTAPFLVRSVLSPEDPPAVKIPVLSLGIPM